MVSRVYLYLASILMTWPSGLAAAERLDVVVSIPPSGWLVEQIGGVHVEVVVLVTPGESPTTYMPTDAQVTHLMRSRLFFRSGVPFERGLWFDAIRQMGRFEMVDLRDGIELRGDDPHIWLNPRFLAVQAETVASALMQVDPNHRQEYAGNLLQLQARLEALDEDIRRSLAPFAGRSFFVFHPSWEYFADEFDLRQVAIESAGREPSDQELTRLQEQARQAGIAVVFVQPQIHGRSAAAFAEAIGARIEKLDPLAADVVSNLTLVTAKLTAAFAEVP